MALLSFIGSALGCLYRERRLNPQQMATVQHARLARLLSFAQQSTQLGKERLAGIDPIRPDLRQIEPITKGVLMEHFDASIIGGALSLSEVEAFAKSDQNAGRMLKGKFSVATTSGTTGEVGYFVTDKKSWAGQNGALFARILRHKLIPSEVLRFSFGRRYRMAMTIATEGHFSSRLVSRYRPFLSRALMTMDTFSIMAPLKNTVEGLNRAQPHYLHSYPTFLEALAHEKLAGKLEITPEFISLGSEPVSALARTTIQKAFPEAELSETYGATECLNIANQCHQGRLHLNTDLCVLEPVDENGNLVPPGVASAKVYVTNLANYAQPLIRYELPDSVTVLPHQCGCGTAMPVIRVEGRSDDTFYLSDPQGDFHAFPPVPFEVLFLDTGGLSQYQLVHEQQNHLHIRYVPQQGVNVANLNQKLSRNFHDFLSQRGVGEAVQIAVEPVDRIEREAKGHKMRQVYSKVKRPALA